MSPIFSLYSFEIQTFILIKCAGQVMKNKARQAALSPMTRLKCEHIMTFLYLQLYLNEVFKEFLHRFCLYLRVPSELWMSQWDFTG